jgi:hypothetical protein
MLRSKRALRKSLSGTSNVFEKGQGRWELMVKWWNLTKWFGKKWYWKWHPPQRIVTQVTGGVGKAGTGH